MLAYLPEKLTQSDKPLAEGSGDGFVERAIKAAGRKAAASENTPRPNGRRQFVQALRVLGARSRLFRGDADCPLPRTLPVFISCPYRTWVRVFGRPSHIGKHGKSPGQIAIHLWRHDCEDGPVTCIGQISERFPGLRWIVLMRVGFYG
jgi:hypothetical protein